VSDDQQPNVIHNQNIRAPLEVPEQRTQPSLVLYEHPYPLSEADFLRLRSSRSTFTSVGAVTLTFTVAYALPRFAPLLLAKLGGNKYTIPATDLRLILLLGSLALVLLGIGQLLSRERREIMGRIAQHFRENPPRTA
jgi:hypothetical protein